MEGFVSEFYSRQLPFKMENNKVGEDGNGKKAGKNEKIAVEYCPELQTQDNRG